MAGKLHPSATQHGSRGWALIGIGLLLITRWVEASVIYRCPPTPDSSSKAAYSDQPCAQGQAVDARDARLPAQQRAAQARAREEGRWAEQMVRQRRQDERTQASQQQRQVAVMDQPRVDISANPRAQAQRDAELRRMSRPPARRDAPPPAPVPPPATAGTAPTGKPGRP